MEKRSRLTNVCFIVHLSSNGIYNRYSTYRGRLYIVLESVRKPMRKMPMQLKTMTLLVAILFILGVRGQLTIQLLDARTVEVNNNVVVICRDTTKFNGIQFAYAVANTAAYTDIVTCSRNFPCAVKDSTKHSAAKNLTNALYDEFTLTLISYSASFNGDYTCWDSNTLIAAPDPMKMPHEVILNKPCSSIIGCKVPHSECKDVSVNSAGRTCECENFYYQSGPVCKPHWNPLLLLLILLIIVLVLILLVLTLIAAMLCCEVIAQGWLIFLLILVLLSGGVVVIPCVLVFCGGSNAAETLKKLFCCGATNDINLARDEDSDGWRTDVVFVLLVIHCIPMTLGLILLVPHCVESGSFSKAVRSFWCGCCSKKSQPKNSGDHPNEQSVRHLDPGRDKTDGVSKQKNEHSKALINTAGNANQQPRVSGAVSRTDIELTEGNYAQEKPVLRPQPPLPGIGKSHQQVDEPQHKKTRGLSSNFEDPNSLPQFEVRKHSLAPINATAEGDSDTTAKKKKKKKKKTEGSDTARSDED